MCTANHQAKQKQQLRNWQWLNELRYVPNEHPNPPIIYLPRGGAEGRHGKAYPDDGILSTFIFFFVLFEIFQVFLSKTRAT